MIAALRLAALAAWTAMLASWALIFVPALFSQLPSTEQVAQLVGATLLRVDQIGTALGLVSLACGLRLALPGPRSRAFAWLPLLGVVAHLASWLWIAPEVRAIREAAGGTVGLLSPGDPQIQRFQTLHTLSFGTYSAASAIALVSAANALFELRGALQINRHKVGNP